MLIGIWAILFGLFSIFGDAERLNFIQPNAWTWFLIIAFIVDLSDMDDAVKKSRRWW